MEVHCTEQYRLTVLANPLKYQQAVLGCNVSTYTILCHNISSVCVSLCPVQVGISFVGLSSVLSGEGSSTHKVSTEEMLMGMGLIVASQVKGGGGSGAAMCMALQQHSSPVC